MQALSLGANARSSQSRSPAPCRDAACSAFETPQLGSAPCSSSHPSVAGSMASQEAKMIGILAVPPRIHVAAVGHQQPQHGNAVAVECRAHQRPVAPWCTSDPFDHPLRHRQSRRSRRLPRYPAFGHPGERPVLADPSGARCKAGSRVIRLFTCSRELRSMARLSSAVLRALVHLSTLMPCPLACLDAHPPDQAARQEHAQAEERRAHPPVARGFHQSQSPVAPVPAATPLAAGTARFRACDGCG